MYPILFHVSMSGAVPRLLFVIALAMGLTVLGLAFLIREKAVVLFSILTASVVTVLLVAIRPPLSSRVSFAVTPFGAALAASIGAGCCLCIRAASRLGLDREWTLRLLGSVIMGGLLGARLGYVLFCTPQLASWREAWSYEGGGLFGYGAYFGALAGALMAARGHRAQLRRLLDVETPTLLGMIGVTRLGCYLEGCDFGRPLKAGTPSLIRALGTYPRWNQSADGSYNGPPAWLRHVSDFGLSTESPVSLATHPTQLYEVLLVLVLSVAAGRLTRGRAFGGRTFLMVALCYSVGRFLLEILRDDPDRGLFTGAGTRHLWVLTSWTQLFAVLTILVVIQFWRKWRAWPIVDGTEMGSS